MLELLLGFLEVFSEFLVQLLLEALVEIGLHAQKKPHRRIHNPWLATLAYTGFGMIIGGVSLLIFPAHLITSDAARFINLFATPVAIGLAMSWLGAWRSRRGQVVLCIDRFACGYAFALALAVVRFIAAE